MKGKLDAINKLSEYLDGMSENTGEGENEELQKGIECEMTEHGMSEEEATKTAQDHLKEDPEYYTKLEEMEASGESEGAETDDSFGSEEEPEEEATPAISVSVLARKKPHGFQKGNTHGFQKGQKGFKK
jgi:hypothetical protein